MIFSAYFCPFLCLFHNHKRNHHQAPVAASIHVLNAGISTDTHIRVVPILTQLGYVYSRSARVTYAEGLYRECAKILKVGAAAPANATMQACLWQSNLVFALAET